ALPRRAEVTALQSRLLFFLPRAVRCLVLSEGGTGLLCVATFQSSNNSVFARTKLKEFLLSSPVHC
ncbi:hypothetical protein CSUI_008640, partial [Cystoisospora suis]